MSLQHIIVFYKIWIACLLRNYISYLVDTFKTKFQNRNLQEKTYNCFSNLWTFETWKPIVTCRDPTPDDSLGVDWRPFSENEAFLHIKQDGMDMENQFRPEQMAFWDSMSYPIRDDGDFSK